MTRPDIHFLTWIEHRRTRELCARLGFTLVELVTRERGARRYLRLVGLTLGWLRRTRPRVLLVQSPSIVLAAFTVLCRPFFRFTLIFDAHNEAVEPYLHPGAVVRRITHWLLRRADAVIVSNAALADVVTRVGGKPLVLTDSIPAAPAVQRRPLDGAFNVVLISTFAGDEPFAEVVTAALALPADVRLYVTGNPARLAAEARDKLPASVTLTGFLDEHAYWNLLASADVVMDLTTMDNCLVCGAYEALAVDRPLILSRNDASVRTFGPFGEFTANAAPEIAAAVSRARARHAELLGSLATEKAAFEKRWNGQAEELLAFARQRTELQASQPAGVQ